LRRVTDRLLGAVRIGCTALTVAVMADWLADPPPAPLAFRRAARPAG